MSSAPAVAALAADVFQLRRGGERAEASLGAQSDDVAAHAVRVTVVAGGDQTSGRRGRGRSCSR